MFQVFHLDIVKLDLDVAYVTMTIYAIYKPMFEVFYVFQTYVLTVSSGCCICCYGYVCMFQAYISSVSSVF